MSRIYSWTHAFLLVNLTLFLYDICQGVEKINITDEQRLLARLMRYYDPSVRPVLRASSPVIIKLGISLTQILDVDEKNQVLTTNVWLDQEWVDEKLKWNRSKFSGIERFRVPCDFIWRPDIVLYNSVDNHNDGYMKSLAMVDFTGGVFWPPIVRMRSSCKMDITYFPFDDQICHLKLGSWAYDGFQVDVVNRSLDIDIHNYVDNGEWTLIDTKVVRNVVFYSCCEEPFPDVTFYFHIRRRVLYYAFNVIIPCVLLSSLSLSGFCLPPDSGERITLGLTVLLAFSVFMLLVAENMPATSEYVPLIGLYLTLIMAMSASSVIFAVYILHIHHRGHYKGRPPLWMKRLVLFIARIMCMNVPIVEDSVYHNYNNISWNESDMDCDKTFAEIAKRKLGKLDDVNTVSDQNSNEQEGEMKPPINGQTLERDVINYFRFLLSCQDKNVSERKEITEWHEVARVVDRVLFASFVLITLLSTLALLIIKPSLKDISIDKFIEKNN